MSNKLIENIDEWMFFHQASNQASHTYDQNTADEVFAASKVFLPKAKELIVILDEKND